MKSALLLVNLGTPKSPAVDDVRAYLREFLGDPYVITLPAPIRFLLLEGIILRTRPKKSAAAYQSIWTERGSPLMFHSVDLQAAVRERLPTSTAVALAMRYGEPSIRNTLAALQKQGVTRICLFPLYPQESLATTTTVIDKVTNEARALQYAPELDVVPGFFDAAEFLAAFTRVAQRALSSFDADHVVLSFHGLPEDHLRRVDPTRKHCVQDNYACCNVDVDANVHCYRRQCVRTAQGLAKRLGLHDGGWSLAFQSRLRGSWVTPFTDETLQALAQGGKKRVAVMCPAFVADCLETLEEIQDRAKHDFVAHGGEDLLLIPSLNSEPAWADAVVAIARRTAPWL